MRIHWSDCAVNNGPALPVGECDCGGLELADDAALVIVGQQDSPLPITERPDEVRIVAVGSAEAERVDMTAMLLAAVGRSENGLTHDQLRTELRKYPDLANRLDKAPTYFYTLISRLTKRGNLAKNGNRIVLLPRGSKTDTAPPARTGEAAKGSGVDSSGFLQPASVQGA